MRKSARWLAAVCMLGMIVVLLVGVRPPAGSAAGKVVLYTADGAETLYDAILPTFEKNTGMKVEVFTSGTGAVASRATVEKDHPAADVLVLVPPFSQAVIQDGIVDKYTPKGSNMVPAALKDPNGYWVTFIGDFTNWGYNPQLVTNPPDSYDDLLNPKYNGKIAYSSPVTAGDGFAVVNTAVTLWGEEKAFAFLKRLEPLVKFHTKGTGFLDVLVSRGEVWISNNDLQELLSDQFNSNMNVKSVFLRSAPGKPRVTVPISYTMELVHNGPNPEGGRMLLDYLMSLDVQSKVPDAYGFPARTDVTAGGAKLTIVRSYMKDVQILPVDYAKVLSFQKTWQARWTKEVQEGFNKQTGVTAPAP
jgi:2-aminoethylphosphonate transport system substrate-binding protein